MLEQDKRELISLPFVKFAPFFAAGMLIADFGGGTSGTIVFVAAFAALIFLAIFAVKFKKAVLCAAGALCGILLMTAYVELYCKPILEYSGKTVETEIFVRDVLSHSGQSEEIVAKTNLGGRTAKVRLTCAEALPEDHIADVTIEFSPTDPNDAAYDLSEGILLSGDIVEIRSSEYCGMDIYSVFRSLRKNFLGNLVRNVFGESGEYGSAILFGESGKLSSKNSEYLKISGAAHYTAVSGAHFAVFAAALLMIIPQERRKVRFWVSLMFAPAGLLFYGMSPSVLRASVMYFLNSMGILFHRKSHPLNSLCIAVTVIPIFSPFTILDAGFAMSVLGVFGVGAVGPAFSEKACEFIPDRAKRALSPIVKALCCSVCAVICTSPISAAMFKSVSVLGVVTSLLLAPFMAIAMVFMLVLGATQIRLCAIPIDWSMKICGAVIKFFGKCRALTLSLDYPAAWAVMTLLALVVTICAFGDIKTFARFAKAAGALLVAIPVISLIICQNRHEVRFVGNTYTSAAIVFDGNSAAVYISGGGDGLAARISRVLRERGATSVTELIALEADYGGALAIRELSEMIPIGEVRSNQLAKGLLSEVNVIYTSSEIVAIGGVTIASATASSSAPNVDILLYNGQMKDALESSAKVAVYFTKKEYDLPESFHNARNDQDFCIYLRE